MITEVDGTRFAWRERGEGSVVALFHGLGGSRTSWEPQLAGLGDQWRVAAWDMPGYGLSQPLAEEPYSFRALAAAAAAWIALLDGEPAHVVGISMGGMIAQYLAAYHPQSVRSLTLMSTSARFGLDGTMPEAWKAARLAPLNQGLEPIDFADQVLRGIAGERISAEAFAEQRSAMGRITGAALRRSIGCLVTHDSQLLLPAITTRVLVMAGEFDTETPPEYAQHLAEHLPNARLVVVPHAGHLLNAAAPEQVNRLIADHLIAVEGR